jgi:hypothetical protein
MAASITKGVGRYLKKHNDRIDELLDQFSSSSIGILFDGSGNLKLPKP